MRPWTEIENNVIVEGYFEMLAADLSGQQYKKSEHNRNLQSIIKRTRGAIEYKHQNISAILMELGETWIPGYAPATNYQRSLVSVVLRHLQQNEQYDKAKHSVYNLSNSVVSRSLVKEPAPTLRSSVPQKNDDQSSNIAVKFDVAERDSRNRILGRAGEQLVLYHEKSVLKSAGRADLARDVRWVSEETGDGLGYDIASFLPDGRNRLIEVKTTNGYRYTPFQISLNELEVSKQNQEVWYLVRVWNFLRTPHAYELCSPLDTRVKLVANNYEARFY